MNDPESKIFVDDDWKSRVAAEKENLKKEVEKSHQDEKDDQGLPPASFPILVSTLATQTLAALGQLPDPYSGQPSVNRPVAKHFIDTLAVLEDKTKGNLTPDESDMLSGVLHELRMAFVATGGKGESAEPPKKSSIELP